MVELQANTSRTLAKETNLAEPKTTYNSAASIAAVRRDLTKHNANIEIYGTEFVEGDTAFEEKPVEQRATSYDLIKVSESPESARHFREWLVAKVNTHKPFSVIAIHL